MASVYPFGVELYTVLKLLGRQPCGPHSWAGVDRGVPRWPWWGL